VILQALKEYYDRKADLPRFGLEEKEIPFIIVIDKEGNPVNIESTYEGEGKHRRAKKFLVPQGVKRASGILANLLWDNPGYALGIGEQAKAKRIAEQHEAFKRRIDELGVPDDAGCSALMQFLAMPDKVDRLEKFGDSWKRLTDEGANLTFRLAGDERLVLQRQDVKKAIAQKGCPAEEGQSICIVTGMDDVTERLHPAIKGVWDAQPSGANIVSYNSEAFCSYGKAQGANAPVGKNAAFAYTTALNYLLGRDSEQRMQVGDASTVFWSEKECDLEKQMPNFFGEPPKDDPDRNVRAVESLYSAVRTGALAHDESTTRFYVLGLAPNASRISIRFWIVDTVKRMAEKIVQHFQDLQIIHGPKEKGVFSLFRLLASTALEGKADNISPNLSGDTMRAILDGLPYPQTLLQAAIRRNRAEQSVTYVRAALIKACINRSTRIKNPDIKEELTMSLEPSNRNIGYRLGRLFAVCEKIQEEANPGINATIRDRFYGSASGTPITVFANLMRLKNHHLAKLESTGRKVYFERLIGEILSDIDGFKGFPATLSIGDQGRFAIGYYHQRQDFYVKKERELN
jgi:CRISPR-associated protein Csd1